MTYDVVIVGSGAGGSTLAHALAPTGLKVCVIERGDFLPFFAAQWLDGRVALLKRLDEEGETR